MYFNEIINKVDSQLKQLHDEINDVEKRRKEEISKAEILINKKYALELKNVSKKALLLEEKSKKIYDEIVKYSEFNINDLSDNISNLLTILTGKKYVYQECYYYCEEESDSFNNNNTGVTIRKRIGIFIDQDYKRDSYSSSDYKLLPIIKSNNAFMISHGIYDKDQKIKFYDYDLVDMKLNKTINFGELNIIYEYIDYLINYKMVNNKHDINNEELFELTKEYVSNNLDNIVTIHSKK